MPGALAHLAPLPAQPLVSVVIPALNEERYIGQLLDSLARQTYPHEYIEVIVADAGSTDGTVEIVARAAERGGVAMRLIANPERTTAHGLNHGADIAKGDVIIVLGAHTNVGPDFVAANVATLKESGAAAAGGPIKTIGEGPVAASIAAALSHPFGVGDAKFRYSDEAEDVDTVAFAAYRRECFDVLGGFDPARKRAEDDDFNYRLRKAGGRLYLSPAIRSRYFGRRTFPGLARQYFGYGQAKGEAFRADPGALGPRHFVPAGVVGGGAVMVLLSLFSGRARVLLTLLAGAYSALAVQSAWKATRGTDGSWPLTLVAFSVVHASYGLGMLKSLLRWRG